MVRYVRIQEDTVLFNFVSLVFLLAAHLIQGRGSPVRVPSSLLEWPRRQEEGEAKLFEMLTHFLSLPGTLGFDPFGRSNRPLYYSSVRPRAHPLRLNKLPVGVPGGTAEGGDSKEPQY